MSNRWIRFLLAVLAIAAAGVAASRVVQNERRIAGDVAATRAAVFAGETTLTAVEELKAALHAYVAPGQGIGFWAARAAVLLDKVRGALLELDRAASANGASLADALDVVDRLAAAEQRARDHVLAQQPLLAGDVIFNDARDLLDTLRMQIVRVRNQITAAAANRQLQLRREQTWLAAGAAGVLSFVLLLLVHPGSASARLGPEARDGATSGASEPVAPAAPVAPGAPDLAELCSRLAAVSDSTQIGGLLDETARLLNAKGVIVWLSSADRNELHAVGSSGYDERLMARISPIHREDGNLTAAAFRDNLTRTSAATVSAAAALALPLPAPGGPAGVFSAELRPDGVLNDDTLAVAQIVAAQLGALLGSIPASSSDRVVASSE